MALGTICIASLGCASSKNTASEPAAATAPAAAAAPEPSPAPVNEPEKPAISKELQDLRDSIQNQSQDIEEKAHAVIEAYAPSAERIEALNVLSQRALNDKKYDEAQLYAKASLDLDAQNYETLMIMAGIARAVEKNDEAVNWLTQAAQVSPDKTAPYVQKAAILLEFLDTERALLVAGQAQKLDPDACDVTIIYADALFAGLQFRDAIIQYEHADSLKCNLSEAALQNMAKLYEIHLQDAKNACQLYERLIKIAPDNPYYKASRDYQCSL